MSKQAERHTAFDTAHPAVPAAYALITLALTMLSLQPVLVALSLAGGFVYGCCARGVRACAAGLRWQLPFVILVALVNPLFSASGSTEVARIGERAIYLESLCYGCVMGALVVASALWFEAAARLVPFDRVMALGGNAAPVVALMLSQCMRLIPRFVRQGRLIAAVQDANAAVACGAGLAGSPTDEGTPTRDEAASGRAGGVAAAGHRVAARIGARATAWRTALRGRLRLSTVLMGWTLEDSLETADAMRARGWGAASRRTSYARHRFRASDARLLALTLIAGAAVAGLAIVATSQYRFYPQMSQLIAWWGYVPYALWMLAPALLHLCEQRRFR